MNIPTTIQVITVVSADAVITYQQVYVNRESDAKADFDRQTDIHKDLLLEGWSITIRRF